MAGKTAYEDTQISAFGSLVREGVYSLDFEHKPKAQQFFKGVMSKVLTVLSQQSAHGLRVIDCGCGNGAWLYYLTAMNKLGHFDSLYGFDLTPEMVAVASERLGSMVPSQNLHSGNILKSDAYQFTGSPAGYDLLYTYDVIQQLPAKLQFAAIETMLDQLSEGGVAVIFDNDARSSYGRMMARKKFFTKYFGLKLVPRYYCNAKYPSLMDFAEKIVESRGVEVGVEISRDGVKRALIVHNVSHCI